MVATISADLISSTALSVAEVVVVKKQLMDLFTRLEQIYPGFWGRIVKGDSIECVIPDPKDALRVALMIKTALKALNIEGGEEKRLFQVYAVRIAIGIGQMRLVDRANDMMDGEAIYLSGRKLEEMGSPVKGTLQIVSPIGIGAALQAVGILVDAIVNKATSKQCQVVYYKLLDKSEQEITEILKINQSSVNQRSTAAKWYAIDAALRYFELIDFS